MLISGITGNQGAADLYAAEAIKDFCEELRGINEIVRDIFIEMDKRNRQIDKDMIKDQTAKLLERLAAIRAKVDSLPVYARRGAQQQIDLVEANLKKLAVVLP